MKSVFDKSTSEELIRRINMLDENNTARWGKMNLYQMLKHCTLWEEMITEKIKCKRVFIGRILGKIILRNALKDEAPIGRGAPTSPELKVNESHGDIATEKTRWITFLQLHAQFSNPDFIHPFFGRMTQEQIGFHAYKHADHHLRQFNA